MNCWEYKKCSQERKEVCPAYPSNGKDCWKITGTKCNGIDQGSREKKIYQCRICNYYKSGNANKF